MRGSGSARSKSEFNLDQFTINGLKRNPAIDPTDVIADLKAFALDGFDQMQVLTAIHFTEHNVSLLEFIFLNGGDRAELPGFDFPFHGITPRTERDGLTCLQLFNVVCGPADGRLSFITAWSAGQTPLPNGTVIDLLFLIRPRSGIPRSLIHWTILMSSGSLRQ